MAHGLRHVTHIWSAMSSTVREGPWRKPGLLESALTFDGLTVEMIADNRHLPPTLMKLATRCIEPERLCVISRRDQRRRTARRCNIPHGRHGLRSK